MTCKWDGKHKRHNVISLEETKNFLKTNMETCIKTLENYGHILQDAPQKAKKELEKIQTKKEQVKELVKKQFDEVRKILKENEIRLLNSIDKIQFDEDKLTKCITESQDAFTPLSSAYQKAKSVLNTLCNAEITPEIARDVISIINCTRVTHDNLRSYNEICGYEMVISSNEFEKEVKTIIQSINIINEVKMNKVSTLIPKGLTSKSVGAFFVSLEWDKNEGDEKYIIAMQKEGVSWDPNSSLECSDNKITLTSLERETTYKFSVMAKRGTFMSGWSDPLEVKTTIPTIIETIINNLRIQHIDPEVCVNNLEQTKELTNESEYIFIFYIHFFNK